jgi:hypothetical protein
MESYTVSDYLSGLNGLDHKQVLPSVLNDLRQLIYYIEIQSALITVMADAGEADKISLEEITAMIDSSTRDMRRILDAFKEYNQSKMDT